MLAYDIFLSVIAPLRCFDEAGGITGSTAHRACVHTQAGVSRPCAPLPTHVNSDLTTYVLRHSDKLLLHISDVTCPVNGVFSSGLRSGSESSLTLRARTRMKLMRNPDVMMLGHKLKPRKCATRHLMLL